MLNNYFFINGFVIILLENNLGWFFVIFIIFFFIYVLFVLFNLKCLLLYEINWCIFLLCKNKWIFVFVCIIVFKFWFWVCCCVVLKVLLSNWCFFKIFLNIGVFIFFNGLNCVFINRMLYVLNVLCSSVLNILVYELYWLIILL